jgi:hypothetical protein
MPVAGNSLVVRREVDAIVFEARKELANHFNKLADEAGEPPLRQAPTTDDTEEDAAARRMRRSGSR